MSKKGQAQEWYIKGPYHYATGKIIEDTRKSVVVLRTSFFSRWRSSDLICIILQHEIGTNLKCVQLAKFFVSTSKSLRYRSPPHFWIEQIEANWDPSLNLLALNHRPVFADKKVIICALCFIQFVVYSMRNPVVYRIAKKSSVLLIKLLCKH